MKITFADPGYDFTALIWTGGIFVALLLVFVVGQLYVKYANPRNYDGFTEHWPAWVLLAAGIWAVFAIGFVAALVGGLGYGNRVENAQVSGLLDAGFDSIIRTSVDGEPDNTYVGNIGEEFAKITLVPDPNAPAGTYVYRVMTWDEDEK